MKTKFNFRNLQLPTYNFRLPSGGFTLIELLVVIAIIAILTTLLMANFVGIRQRGRDGQRKANINNIQTALELYRADNGSYPLSAEFPDCGDSLVGPDPNNTVYMQSTACDPLSDSQYTYNSTDGTIYTLIACLENENDANKDDVKDVSCTTTPASFTVTNP